MKVDSSSGESGVHDSIVARYRQPAAQYRSQHEPGWLHELKLIAGPPHHHMASRALGDRDWLAPDEFQAIELDLRHRLHREVPELVVAYGPHAGGPTEEAVDHVAAHEHRHGRTVDWSAAEDPLACVGLSIQEDLLVMVRASGRWTLEAAFVCFPAVWSLPDKIGLGVAAIHGPVPHYPSELESRVDRLLDRLRPSRPLSRRNLSLKPDHALFVPVAKAAKQSIAVDVGEEGQPYWLRSEFQTFHKLPRTDSILFTIKTQIAPASVLMGQRSIAADLLAMYTSWDSAMRAYKMADSNIERNLFPWLRSVANGGS